jgi:hypothetical protein
MSRIFKLGNTTLGLAALVSAIAIAAIVTHYPGSVELRVGRDGGWVVIDGRQPTPRGLSSVSD